MSFNMEEYVYEIASTRKRQRKIGFIILGLLLFALGMIPTGIVLAKMLPIYAPKKNNSLPFHAL